MLKKFITDESAATAIEYGLIVAVLSLAIIGGLSAVMTAIQENFEYAAGIMDDAIDQ